MKTLIRGKSSQFWSILAISMSILVAISAILFIILKETFQKKISLATGIFSFVLLIVFVTFAQQSHSFTRQHDQAIIVSNGAPAFQLDKTATNDSIPGGAKVKFLDSIDSNFLKIELKNERVILVNVNDIRVI